MPKYLSIVVMLLLVSGACQKAGDLLRGEKFRQPLAELGQGQVLDRRAFRRSMPDQKAVERAEGAETQLDGGA